MSGWSLSPLPADLNEFVSQPNTCCSDHQSSTDKQVGPYPLRSRYLEYCQREPCEEQTGRSKNGERSPHSGSGHVPSGIKKKARPRCRASYRHAFPHLCHANVIRKRLTEAIKGGKFKSTRIALNPQAGVQHCL